MKTKLYIGICISTLLFTSCTKEITIDLNTSNPQLVIEAVITDEPGPYYVKLSKTINISESNNYPTVSGALVIISDNTGVSDTLVEVSSGLYQTNTLIGVPGNTYWLKVVSEGKDYSATSTMPYVVNLDTVLFDTQTSMGTSNEILAPIPVYNDPITTGNNYQFLLNVNGTKDKTYYVRNDSGNNGVTIQEILESEEIEIQPGDTVILSMSSIEYNTYLYFYTLSQQGGNFLFSSSPSNPPNNIIGNKAFGYFSAQTKQTKTLIAE